MFLLWDHELSFGQVLPSLVPTARAGHCQGSGGHGKLIINKGLYLNCIKVSPWSLQQEQGIVRQVVGMKYYERIVLVLYQIPSLVPAAREQGIVREVVGMKYYSWIVLVLYQIPSLVPAAREQGIVREVVGMKYYSWIALVLYQILSLDPTARAGHCQGSGGHEILFMDCTCIVSNSLPGPHSKSRALSGKWWA